MNIFAIFSGLTVLAIATFIGYVGVLLFIEGGTTPVFGGIAMVVLAIMALTLGVVLIGMGCAGIVFRIRSGKAAR